MNLLPFFQSFEASGVGRLVRESVWGFAVIESFHLLSLVMLGGSVLLVDLRILNFGLRDRSIGELAREARPWRNLGLVVMLLTGYALFASEATKCYYSTPFWVKISTLVVAILFTYTVHNRATLSNDSHASNGKVVIALISMALWFVVAAAGRWIGFSG
ncbi:MAG: DUF6644 family protein [Vicinamibacterales bacterium]